MHRTYHSKNATVPRIPAPFLFQLQLRLGKTLRENSFGRQQALKCKTGHYNILNGTQYLAKEYKKNEATNKTIPYSGRLASHFSTITLI